MGLGALNQYPVNAIPVNGWQYPSGAEPLPPLWAEGEMLCIPPETYEFYASPEQHVFTIACEQTTFNIPAEQSVFMIPAGKKTCS